MLYLIEPMNITGVYGIMDIAFLKVLRPRLFASTPSIIILPASEPSELISHILNMAWIIEDFPAPVRPTQATFSPPLILRSTPFKVFSRPSLYLKWTFLNSIDPWFGHPFARIGSSLGRTIAASYGSLVYLSIRSTEVICRLRVKDILIMKER